MSEKKLTPGMIKTLCEMLLLVPRLTDFERECLKKLPGAFDRIERAVRVAEEALDDDCYCRVKNPNSTDTCRRCEAISKMTAIMNDTDKGDVG